MDKIKKILGGRLLWTGLAILIQLLIFLSFLVFLTDYFALLSGISALLSIMIALYLISNSDPSSYKIAWIIIIMLMPFLGGILYLFFGNKRPTKKMREKIQAYNSKYQSHLRPDGISQNNHLSVSDRHMGTLQYLDGESYPAWGHTTSTYYPLGDLMYPEMLKALEEAKEFIFMEYFIIESGVMWDGIFEVLKKKAKEGLDVRVMYDDMGCLGLVPAGFPRDLASAGIKCLPFNPFRPVLSVAINNRDHRKITVIDGRIAFSGGVNLADEYINAIVKHGHWKDTGIRIQGDGVRNFTLMFLEMWNAFKNENDEIDKFLKPPGSENVVSDGVVVPFGDSPLDEELVGQGLYIDILNQATDYVYIFTPYLIIEGDLLSALMMAAKRGVDVRLVTPGIPDKEIVYRVTRSYYPQLRNAGVKIYEYTPGFLHAKSYISDDQIAVIGTINMDFRSLCLHFECGVLMIDSSTILDMKEDFLQTLSKCGLVGAHSPRYKRLSALVDNAIRAFAPLM